jgi:hypothetical protein
MNFKEYLETDIYQSVLPFMKEEPKLDKNISKYKSKEDYVKSMGKSGRKTEIAAEKIVSARISSWIVGEEEILEIVNKATFIKNNDPNRPQFNINFTHVKSKELLPNNKSRFRILAFWQGTKENINKQEIINLDPLGGIVYIGGYITDVYVKPEFRGKDKFGFSLYKELRKFASRRGIISTAPNDDLTSKSYRMAQAKYDYDKNS